MPSFSSGRGAWLALALASTVSTAGAYQIYSSSCAQEAMLQRSLTTLSGVVAQDVAAALRTSRAALDAPVGVVLTDALKTTRFPISPGTRSVTADSAFQVVLLSRTDAFVAGTLHASEIGRRERQASAHVSLSGTLAGYQLVVTPRHWLTEDLGEGMWTWERAQLAIAILTISLLTLIAIAYHLHRDRVAARLRERFVASVSHELRTPLTQIRMFAELLSLDWVRTSVERDRAISIINQEARRLTTLVENVLQFSSPERIPSASGAEAVDVPQLVHEVFDAFGPDARTAEVGLRATMDCSAQVWANRDALRQVLMNLVDNGIKYGRRGGMVEVSMHIESDAQVALTVEDNGRGIPWRDRHRIFDPFVRGADVHTIVGSGIGLAVVRDLMHRMGGSVDVTDAPGGGASFRVRLPGHGIPAPTLDEQRQPRANEPQLAGMS